MASFGGSGAPASRKARWALLALGGLAVLAVLLRALGAEPGGAAAGLHGAPKAVEVEGLALPALTSSGSGSSVALRAPPKPGKRLLLLSVASGPFSVVAKYAECTASQMDYAAAHGFEFRLVRDSSAYGLPPSWSKVPVTIAALKEGRHDFVAVLDNDIYVRPGTPSLLDTIDKPSLKDKWFYAAHGWSNRINAGMMIFRGGDEAVAFLEAVLADRPNRPPKDTWAWGPQGYLLAENDHIILHTRSHTKSFHLLDWAWNNNRDPSRRDDFFRHYTSKLRPHYEEDMGAYVAPELAVAAPSQGPVSPLSQWAPAPALVGPYLRVACFAEEKHHPALLYELPRGGVLPRPAELPLPSLCHPPAADARVAVDESGSPLPSWLLLVAPSPADAHAVVAATKAAYAAAAAALDSNLRWANVRRIGRLVKAWGFTAGNGTSECLSSAVKPGSGSGAAGGDANVPRPPVLRIDTVNSRPLRLEPRFPARLTDGKAKPVKPGPMDGGSVSGAAGGIKMAMAGLDAWAATLLQPYHIYNPSPFFLPAEDAASPWLGPQGSVVVAARLSEYTPRHCETRGRSRRHRWFSYNRVVFTTSDGVVRLLDLPEAWVRAVWPGNSPFWEWNGPLFALPYGLEDPRPFVLDAGHVGVLMTAFTPFPGNVQGSGHGSYTMWLLVLKASDLRPDPAAASSGSSGEKVRYVTPITAVRLDSPAIVKAQLQPDSLADSQLTYEKNWMPVVHGDRLWMLHTVCPLEVMSLKLDTIRLFIKRGLLNPVTGAFNAVMPRVGVEVPAAVAAAAGAVGVARPPTPPLCVSSHKGANSPRKWRGNAALQVWKATSDASSGSSANGFTAPPGPGALTSSSSSVSGNASEALTVHGGLRIHSYLSSVHMRSPERIAQDESYTFRFVENSGGPPFAPLRATRRFRIVPSWDSMYTGAYLSGIGVDPPELDAPPSDGIGSSRRVWVFFGYDDCHASFFTLPAALVNALLEAAPDGLGADNEAVLTIKVTHSGCHVADGQDPRGESWQCS